MNFIQRRVLTAIAAFAVTVNLIFIIPRLVPGSAAAIFASGSHVPAVAVVLISKRLGLDQPLAVQYELYLKGLFASWPPYFGVSYEFYPEPVTSLIATRLPWTLLLLVSSLFLAFSISYTLATIGAMRRGGKFEFGSLYASIFFWSIPGFWIGMILIWVFSVSLKWFPVFGTVGFNSASGVGLAYAVLIHAILPVITLTLVIFGQNYMLLRGAAQEVLNADYVNAAKARGLKDRAVASSYVMRNSMLPVMSLMGYSIASIISAEILIESVFSYGGLGDLIVDAIVNRDYPVIEGSFFFVTTLVIVFFLVGDFLMLRLDPRLKE